MLYRLHNTPTRVLWLVESEILTLSFSYKTGSDNHYVWIAERKEILAHRFSRTIHQPTKFDTTAQGLETKNTNQCQCAVSRAVLSTNLRKIHLNTIQPAPACSSHSRLSPCPNPACVPCLLQCLPPTLHSPESTTGPAHITQFIQSFILLISKYLPNYFVFRHLQFTFFFQSKRQCFMATQGKWQNYCFVDSSLTHFGQQTIRQQFLSWITTRISKICFPSNFIMNLISLLDMMIFERWQWRALPSEMWSNTDQLKLTSVLDECTAWSQQNVMHTDEDNTFEPHFHVLGLLPDN